MQFLRFLWGTPSKTARVAMASPFSLCQQAQSETETAVPLLTRDSLTAVLQRVGPSWRLCSGLGIHKTWEKIEQLNTSEKLKVIVNTWMSQNQQPSWRAVVYALDCAGQTDAADEIISYAEPLADPTLTVKNVTSVLKKVVGGWDTLDGLFYNLDISDARQGVIKKQHSSDEERILTCSIYWVNNSPSASWQRLAGELYAIEQDAAVEAVKKFLPDENDPSLTTDKLMEVLGEVEEEWDNLGTWLNIPAYKQEEIRGLYSDDSQRLRASLTHWVHTHPCPLWGDVVRALEGIERGYSAESVRENYVKATERSKELFREAMENGFIRATDHTILMIGFAGNGKTSSMCLLVDKDPPEERTSTPCAEAPVRTVATSRMENIKNQWNPVKRSDLSQMVAERSLALQQGKTKKVTSQQETSVKKDTPDHSHDQTSSPHSSSHSSPAQKPTRSRTSAASKMSRKADIREEIAGKMDRCLISKPKQEIHWVNIVDSGGQPQFHESLPTFIPEIAACFHVVKLSESLEDRPMVEMFKKNKLLGSYRSPVSHLQTLQYCMRTVQSHMSRGGESPLIAFIGTHKDLEHECPESRADKNRKLKEILPPDKHKVLFIDHEEEVLVAFNAKKPGTNDKKLAGCVRSWVMKHSPAKPKDIPLQYYGLEARLHDLMKDAKRGVFAKVECRAAAEILFFNNESFEAALKYLTHLKIILYYDSILPDVVFCSSQVLLDKVSELVSFYYQQPSTALMDRVEKNFQEQAIVTLELLKKERFSSHYVEGLFGPEQLIKLLQNEQLLLLAKVSDKEYLLPCALPTVESNKLFEHPSSSIPPLLVFFPQGGPRLGVFCRLAAYLLTIAKWSLLMRNKVPVEVKRNSIAFTVPGDIPGRVTVRDSLSSFFMISISTRFAEELCEVYPRVRATILDGIQHVSNILKYVNSTPTDAFLCSGKGCRSSPHPAIVSSGKKFKVCTVNPETGSRVTDKELVWFPKATASSTSAKVVALKKKSVAHTSSPAQPPAMAATQREQSTNTSTPTWPPAMNDTLTELSSTHTLTTPQPSTMADSPTLLDLLQFKRKNGQTMNIPREIGTSYLMLGTILLQDHRGARVKALEAQYQRDANRINYDILMEWIGGGGVQPVTWGKLIEVLTCVGLVALAEDIEDSLC